jgi:hypothetical protein
MKGDNDMKKIVLVLVIVSIVVGIILYSNVNNSTNEYNEQTEVEDEQSSIQYVNNNSNNSIMITPGNTNNNDDVISKDSDIIEVYTDLETVVEIDNSANYELDDLRDDTAEELNAEELFEELHTIIYDEIYTGEYWSDDYNGDIRQVSDKEIEIIYKLIDNMGTIQSIEFEHDATGYNIYTEYRHIIVDIEEDVVWSYAITE